MKFMIFFCSKTKLLLVAILNFNRKIIQEIDSLISRLNM